MGSTDAINKEKIVEIEYEERFCDICGSRELECVFSETIITKTNSEKFRWNNRVCVCKKCGFTFLSPSPTKKSLESYYRDHFTYYSGQTLDYSIEKRIDLLKKYFVDGKKVFVEVGGNDNTIFKSSVTPFVEKYYSVELNSNCVSDFSDINQITTQIADIIAAYFVLTCIPDVKQFLKTCNELLNDNGIIILEVPNLYLYPMAASGFFFEQTSHFSPHTLSLLAANQGFSLVEISYQKCSRDFGFVAVFKKIIDMNNNDPLDCLPYAISPQVEQNFMGSNEFLIAKSCILEGTNRRNKVKNKINEIKEKIIDYTLKKNGPIIIWGANDICIELLTDFPVTDGIYLVDSDPKKRDFFQSIPVHTPDKIIDIIRISTFFVINSYVYGNEIKEVIEKYRSSKLKANEYFIVDKY